MGRREEYEREREINGKKEKENGNSEEGERGKRTGSEKWGRE